MKADSLKNWLNSSQDFNTGVALFNCYGDDESLKQMFAQGFSTFRQARLKEVLMALYQSCDKKVQTAPLEPTVEKILVNKVTLPEAAIEKEKDPYYTKWIKPYKEMQRLCTLLPEEKNIEKRGEMCFKILELEQHCMYWWDRRDYYLKHGHLLEDSLAKEQLKVTDKNQILRQLTNARANLSKVKSKLALNPDNPKFQERFATLKETIKDLEKKLEYGFTEPEGIDEPEGTTGEGNV